MLKWVNGSPSFLGHVLAVATMNASATTTPADLAPFTPDDLDETRSRLTRLAKVFDVRLRGLTDEELDQHAADARSPRQIAFHLEESLYYADAVGNLRG
jgi:hypothetical protein